MQNNNFVIGGSENTEINIDYKMPLADKVLEDDVECHLESDDPDNDVYDDDGDEFESESLITQ